MLNDLISLLKDFFGFLGSHPVALIAVVIIACLTLLRPDPRTGNSKRDN